MWGRTTLSLQSHVYSLPIVSIQASILYGFRQMLGRDVIGVIQVGDGSRHLEDPVVSAGTQTHAPHRRFERSLTGLVQRAEFP